MSMIKAGCLSIVAITGVAAAVLAVGFGLALLFGVMRLPLTNLDRQVTTHTQAYVQTHQTMMLDFYADYQSGDAPHKAAAQIEVCAQAALLDRSDWPAQVAPFATLACR